MAKKPEPIKKENPLKIERDQPPALEREVTRLTREAPRLERDMRLRIDRSMPDLGSMFEDDGDPLEGVEDVPDDLEATATGEMTQIVQAIHDRKRALFERFRTERDPDYWCALCFQSREQRDEFLIKSGWAMPGEAYLNGLQVARALKIPIEPIPLEPIPIRGKPHKFTREEVI